MKITDNYNLIGIHFNFSRSVGSIRVRAGSFPKNGETVAATVSISSARSDLTGKALRRPLRNEIYYRNDAFDHENRTYPSSVHGDVPKVV